MLLRRTEAEGSGRRHDQGRFSIPRNDAYTIRDCLRVAQSDAGIGPAAVLSRPLRAVFEEAVRGLADSCNKSLVWYI